MNPQADLETVVKNFTVNFDRMCKMTGRAYLMRSTTSSNENVKGGTRYDVNYQLKTTKNGWKIYAKSRFWLIFSKEFPLLKINKTDDGKITFEGLFVKQSPTINQNPAELHNALSNYLNYCRNLPEETFVNV